jgi:hypothetical protein
VQLCSYKVIILTEQKKKKQVTMADVNEVLKEAQELKERIGQTRGHL